MVQSNSETCIVRPINVSVSSFSLEAAICWSLVFTRSILSYMRESLPSPDCLLPSSNTSMWRGVVLWFPSRPCLSTMLGTDFRWLWWGRDMVGSEKGDGNTMQLWPKINSATTQRLNQGHRRDGKQYERKNSCQVKVSWTKTRNAADINHKDDQPCGEFNCFLQCTLGRKGNCSKLSRGLFSICNYWNYFDKCLSWFFF